MAACRRANSWAHNLSCRSHSLGLHVAHSQRWALVLPPAFSSHQGMRDAASLHSPLARSVLLVLRGRAGGDWEGGAGRRAGGGARGRRGKCTSTGQRTGCFLKSSCWRSGCFGRAPYCRAGRQERWRVVRGGRSQGNARSLALDLPLNRATPLPPPSCLAPVSQKDGSESAHACLHAMQAAAAQLRASHAGSAQHRQV